MREDGVQMTQMAARRNPRIRGIASLVLLLAVAPMAMAQIRLSLEPAQVSVDAGASFELQLWARADSAQSFDGADVALRWDAALLTLDGHSDEGAPYGWMASEFPAASPLNTDWSDGDALYECLAAFAGAAPQTDLLITTLQFTAAATAGAATVSIPRDGDTVVPSAGLDVLDAATGAAVTIGGGSGGGGGGGDSGGGTNGNDNGSDIPTGDGGGDSGNDNSGNVDDTPTGTGDGGGTNGNENGSDTTTGDGGGDPGNDNAGNAGDTDTATGGGGGHTRAGGGAPLCGPWAMQALVACTMGLCAIRFARRSQGG